MEMTQKLWLDIFGPFQCPRCGKISRDEFPFLERQQIKFNSLLLLIPAILVTAILVVLFVGFVLLRSGALFR